MMNTHSDFYVYCYFRPETGQPCYIGKGRNGRWKQHLTNSSNIRLKRIIAKNGGEIPHVKIHVGLTCEQANEYEKALIKAIGRASLGPLVNLTDGGEGNQGWVPSDETKRKNAESSRKRIAASPELRARLAAVLNSPEVRAKIKYVNLGRKASTETRTKMSLARIGRKLSPESIEQGAAKRRGVKRSAESIAKVVAALTGRKQDPAHTAKVVAKNLGKKRPIDAVIRTAEANRGRKHTSEVIAKMRIAHQNMSEETRAKMRAAKVGRKQNPEHVAKRFETINRNRAARLARLSVTHAVDRPEAR